MPYPETCDVFVQGTFVFGTYVYNSHVLCVEGQHPQSHVEMNAHVCVCALPLDSSCLAAHWVCTNDHTAAVSTAQCVATNSCYSVAYHANAPQTYHQFIHMFLLGCTLHEYSLQSMLSSAQCHSSLQPMQMSSTCTSCYCLSTGQHWRL